MVIKKEGEGMYDIRMLTQDECLDRWVHIKPYLEKALAYSRGEWTPNEILKEIMVQPLLFHLWEISNDGKVVALASTRSINYGSFSSLHIITLANVATDEDIRWEDYQEEALEPVIKMAREAGLDRIEVTGRRGWVRKLKSIGWKEQYITMDMELKGESDA